MKVTYFNRHQSMSSETRKKIRELIRDLHIIENCSTFGIINSLYGAFDGYDYSESIKSDPVFESLRNRGNGHIAQEILDIFDTISKYPRTEEPNNNNF